jgi:ParB-like chromosome segregation protein Spo0J
VVASINQFGFNQPIVIDRNNVIIAGHTRYQALVRLGWTTAPCVVLDVDEEKAKAYRIADNKTAEYAEWDDDKLIAELREITKTDDIQAFFDFDLTELLKETAGSLEKAIETETATAEKIKAAEDKQETGMEDASTQRTESMLDVVCPHCLGTFMIQKSSFDQDDEWKNK